MTREDFLGYLTNDQVQAFLRVIRQGESSQDDSAYTVMFGGSHFESFEDHPRIVHTANGLSSSAAGAYQFLQRTWDSLVKQYGFPDFSPINQDCAAVALIHGRGALQSVLQGQLDEAIRKCGKEWASLPGSPYGQPTLTLEKAREVFRAYGGQVSDAVPQPVAASNPAKEVTMAPLVLPILSALTSLIPALGQLFGSGSEVANRNIAAGTILAQKITEVTQSVNLQEAAEKIQNDPQALQAARDIVREVLPQITEAGGGGIDGARKAAASTEQLPFYKQPSVIFTAATLPLVYIIVAAVVLGVGGREFSDEVKVMVVTAIIALLGAGSAFFLGSSFSSQKKDSAIAGMR